jgi:hypothetical protein
MRRLLLAGLAALTVLPAAAVTPPASGPLDLETIMANPDWMGQAVEMPYWSVDGRSIYYSLKRDGSPVQDLYRVDPASGKHQARSRRDGAGRRPGGVRPHTSARRVVLHGDVFVVDLASGRRVQVTRTPQEKSSPQFSADGRALQYPRRQRLVQLRPRQRRHVARWRTEIRRRSAGQEARRAGRSTARLFKTLREIKADKHALKDEDKALDAADPGRAPRRSGLATRPAVDTELSPDGRWLLVVTQPKDHDDGKAPVVNHYVTESGYTEPKTRAPMSVATIRRRSRCCCSICANTSNIRWRPTTCPASRTIR